MTVSPWQASTLELVALLGAARLIEVGVSSLRARAAWVRRRVLPVRGAGGGALALAHLVVLGGVAASVLLVRDRPPPAALLAGSLGVLLAATALRAWVYLTLGERWSVHVVDPGRIATGGPFRLLRHPTYLAVLLEAGALPLAAAAYELTLPCVAVVAVALGRRIPVEERTLARYPEYRGQVLARLRLVPWPRGARHTLASSSGGAP